MARECAGKRRPPLACPLMKSPEQSAFTALRLQMVETQLRARGIKDPRVLTAMASVPRHAFVAERYGDEAYEDHPLPIGEEQTISQPYIVAVMLEMLALAPDDRVLEVGTGSGYVTALLAVLVAEVVSLERHAALADHARRLLLELGYRNALVVAGDGSDGYQKAAPFDAILVSAAASAVPPALLSQLARGGRMVIPVGPAESQQLQLIHMRDGRPHTTGHELCRFVPLVS
jgi:protein-L-isoaspartate(D-aspartate) O-methyltransferase